MELSSAAVHAERGRCSSSPRHSYHPTCGVAELQQIRLDATFTAYLMTLRPLDLHTLPQPLTHSIVSQKCNRSPSVSSTQNIIQAKALIVCSLSFSLQRRVYMSSDACARIAALSFAALRANAALAVTHAAALLAESCYPAVQSKVRSVGQQSRLPGGGPVDAAVEGGEVGDEVLEHPRH